MKDKYINQSLSKILPSLNVENNLNYNSKLMKKVYLLPIHHGIKNKKLLDLNPDLELSLQYFRPGVEILFPSPGVLRQGPFVVDRQAARYFYEINSYYSAFDKEFNRQTAEIGRLLKNKK